MFVRNRSWVFVWFTQVHDVEQAQRIAVMQPDSYDLRYDQWFHNVDFVWPARAIQPIDTRRIALWHEINDLPKRGRLSANDRLGSGSVPTRALFVQHDGSLGSTVTERISMLPLTHNADSFAYRPGACPRVFATTMKVGGGCSTPRGVRALRCKAMRPSVPWMLRWRRRARGWRASRTSAI